MAHILEKYNKFYVVESKYVAGKRKRIYLDSFNNKDDAELYRLSYERDKINGTEVVPSRKTFESFMNEYLNYMSVESWSLNTQKLNYGLIQKHVIPKLGNIAIKDIKPNHIANLIIDLRKTKRERPTKDKILLSNKTIQLIYDIINCSFKYAVEQEYISSNPVKISRPQNKKPADIRNKEKDWTESDIAQILNKQNKNMMELFTEIMFMSSLRESETAAIEIKNIDLEKRIIIIENIIGRVDIDKLESPRALKEITKVFDKSTENSRSVLVLKTPKTINAKRIIVLNDQMIIDIKKRLQDIEKDKHELKDKYHDYGLLFTNKNGTPLENRNVQNRFKKWQEEYVTPDGRKLPIITPYRLRHYSCTAKLRLSNNDVKAVQRDMGIASPEMVNRVYSMMEGDESAFAMSEVMEKNFMNDISGAVHDSTEKKATIEDLKKLLRDFLFTHPESRLDLIKEITKS